jgi:hypothetical protein
MFSLEGIRDRSRLAARNTAQEARRPYIVEADDLADFHLTIRAGVVPTFPFPFIGPHRPPGFIATGNRYFVDSRGSEAVEALPLLAFVKKLREGYAYAVVEAGQFQLCVQEYEVSAADGRPRAGLASHEPPADSRLAPQHPVTDSLRPPITVGHPPRLVTESTTMVDALGVPLEVGQRVVYAVAGIHATGELTSGTIRKLARVQRSDGAITDRIGIQRPDGRRITLYWAKRILVVRKPSSAERPLRYPLESPST